MALRIVVNPKSGSGKGARLVAGLVDHDIVMINPSHIRMQLEKHVHPGDTVVIVGGDGTVSLVTAAIIMTGLAESVKIVIYPLGTGNDIHRALHQYRCRHQRRPSATPLFPRNDKFENWINRLNSTVADGQSGVAAGEDQLALSDVILPIWQFANVGLVAYLGIGLDARILMAVERARRRLPSSVLLIRFLYFIAGIAACRYRINQHIEIEIDQSHTIDLYGKVGLIVSNIGSYGGGSKIGDNDVSQQSFDLTFLGSYYDLIKITLNRFSGSISRPDFGGIESIRIRGNSVPMQIDGEIVEFRPGSVSHLGNARFIC